MNWLRAQLHRHPTLRAALRAARMRLVPGAASTELVQLHGDAAGRTARSLRSAWQHDAIPQRQRRLVEAELAAYRGGQPLVAFDTLVDMLRSAVDDNGEDSLLEIGCSSGHYADVLQIAGIPIRYSGCDYSQAFIDLARELYPHLPFDLADATSLHYPNNAFDIVVSGGCLLHIPDYGRAIAETARITRRTAIFHRTPVLHRCPTRTFTKKAYGVPVVEIHFNEQELTRLFAANGLRIVDIATLSSDWRDGDAIAVKTYKCEKAPA